MLAAVGVGSVTELFEPIDPALRLNRPLNVPAALDEASLAREMAALAGRNASSSTHVSFLGAGIYDHFSPAVVDAIISRGEFLTSYTPYQPEMSQGMLQAVYEYQSLVCALTGMELANASMYDAATAIAEAALMAVEATGRKTVVVSPLLHPHYLRVLATYVRTAGYTLVCTAESDLRTSLVDPATREALSGAACLVLQSPNFMGIIEDLPEAIRCARDSGALSVVSVDPVSLGLLAPPGDFGADVVVGEGQGLGLAQGFGGPLLGFFACRLEHQRRFPGRIVGATVDSEGRRGYTMTLRTREQDIRRERATSNICTNEALCALAASVHLCAIGPQGLREMADLCFQKAHYAHRMLCAIPGIRPASLSPFFDEFALLLPDGADVVDLIDTLLNDGVIAGLALAPYRPDLPTGLLIAVTENRTRQDIDQLASAVAEYLTGRGPTHG